MRILLNQSIRSIYSKLKYFAVVLVIPILLFVVSIGDGSSRGETTHNGMRDARETINENSENSKEIGMSDVVDVDPQEGHELVLAGVLLLDVRDQDEWDAGHAQEAVHIPLSDLEDRVSEIAPDQKVVAICRSGVRSARAAKILLKYGIDTVNLAGGTKAWVDAGFPIVKNDGSPGKVI